MPVPVYFSFEMPGMRYYPYAAGTGKRRSGRSFFQQSGYFLLCAFFGMDFNKIARELFVCEENNLAKVGISWNGAAFGIFDSIWDCKELLGETRHMAGSPSLIFLKNPALRGFFS